MCNGDRFIFGPLNWNPIYDSLKIAIYKSPSPRNKQLFVKLMQLLLHALPCPLCRNSYAVYGDPFFNYKNTDLEHDVWSLHQRVNQKLGIVRNENKQGDVPLPFDKFRKRMLVWSSFSSAQSLWDLFFVLAFTYPEDEIVNNGSIKESRRHCIIKYIQTLCLLLIHSPFHYSVCSLILEKLKQEKVFKSSKHFFEWLYDCYTYWFQKNMPPQFKIESLEEANNRFRYSCAHASI